MTAGASAIAASAGGSLLPLAILLPALGVLMSLLLGGRRAEWIALGLMPLEFAVAAAIAYFIWRSGQPLVYTLAGYAPPLGIALRADGFSAVMLVTAGLIAPAAALYARTNFATPQELTEKRAPLVFWTLLQGIQAALSLVFLGGDLFNLYVGLELLTFAAVPLVCTGRTSRDGGGGAALSPVRAVRLGVLSARRRLALWSLWHARHRASGPAYSLRACRMAGGRADDRRAPGEDRAFPIAFVAAPGPRQRARRGERGAFGAGGKGSFFLVVRLWFDVLAALPGVIPGTILAALGSAAILFGSVLALRQARLKLLIAYSTVAQIGYLFIMFPLGHGPWAADAFTGGVMQALSHAFAKAAMFLSAGLIAESLGHDRIAELGGAARALPVTFLALGLGGLSLMGLPPSGGFAAKWLLMKASIAVRPVGVGDRHGGWRTAGWRISLSRARPRAFGRKPATEESSGAQPRERRAGSGACRAPARVRAAIVLRLPADRPSGRRRRAAMSALAQQFGPVLLIATLAAPLVVLAIFLAPGLRGLARAITPLAALPALGAAALAIGGAPFGAELPALRVSLWLDRPGGLLLAAASLVWLIVSIFALREREGTPNADRFAIAWLLTMAGSLGVFIAADLLTFYLVYALVSVPAYYLVAHDEDAELAPRRRRLSCLCAAGRGGAPDRLRHAGGGRAERQPCKFAMWSPRSRLRPGAMRRWRSSSLASA